MRQAGAACGCVITGTDKIRSGYGNGDCLYLDFGRMVFAVADGTERFPWASRDLLRRLSERLARGGVPGTAREWKDMINGEIYSEQKFQHKTTLSCAAVVKDGAGVNLIVSHGGDSAVMVVDSASGAAEFRTSPDMNFAGRSREIGDVTEHRPAGRDRMLVLASDGFDDLIKFCAGRPLLPGIAGLIAAPAGECPCESMHGILDANRGAFEHDDIGVIIIDPFRVERVEGRAVLVGGTRPNEERKFLEDNPPGSKGGWVQEGEWDGHAALLEGAGIEIVRE